MIPDGICAAQSVYLRSRYVTGLFPPARACPLRGSRLQTNPYNRFFSFFGLRENPFAVSPDPRYLFMTRQIQEAWDAISYGIQSREGIILLTGEAGTGKTTLINRLLEWLNERHMPTAFIFNSHLEPKHLFDFMLADFGVGPDPRWQNNALLCLSQWLSDRSREGRIPVLIVDEAQGLPLHVLEEIRMLINLETPHEKLLQIVLAGQPELEEKLRRPEMRHLTQRIAVRCRTGALSLEETYQFVQARLNGAGACGKPIFSPEAIEAVHDYSRGIPRMMNVLCEHALINAYAGNMRGVSVRVVNEIAREFQFDEAVVRPSRSTTVRARVYEPMFPAEVLPLPVPAIQESAPSDVPPEAAVAQVFSVPVEAIPVPTACEQPTILAAEHNEPVSVSQSSIPSMTLTPVLPSRTSPPKPTADAVGKDAAVKIGNRSLTDLNMMIGRVLAQGLSEVVSSIARARLLDKARNLGEALRRGCAQTLNGRVLHQLATTARSRIVYSANFSFTACSNVARSLGLLWQDAGLVWSEAKGFVLRWLRKPLNFPMQVIVLKPNSEVLSSFAKIASPLRLARSRQGFHGEIRPVLVPANRPSRSAPVRQWLREPFRRSDFLRSSSQAASQRNRTPSAL